MRLVQVGCLGMGKRWVQVGLASDLVEVVGYVDVRPDHLRQIQTEFDISPKVCFDDVGQAIDQLSPDAVLIVTPPQFHAEVAVKAMQSGCHVLTEKPLADTWEQCRRIAAVAEETNKVAVVSQNYRYRPPIQALRSIIQEGRFGRPGQVTLEFYRGPHFGGFREEMPHPLIVDMSIHHFDLLRYVLQADPVSLYARSWNPEWSWFKGDASATSFIEMKGQGESGVPDSRISVTYTGSWCAQGATTSWNGHWTVLCDGGSIELVNDTLWGQAGEGAPREELPIPDMESTDQAAILEAFVRAIHSEEEPETSARDNIKSIEMVFKTVESCEQGRPVRLEGH